MKIAISAGHNVYNGKYFDCGSVGNGKRECDITKETVKILIQMLKKQGHAVLDVTPYNEYFATKMDHHVVRCRRVDEFNADLYLDIHINAGGGTGVEIWTYGPNSKANSYAEKISENISDKIGIENRGVKHKPGYWSVSLCKAPAMIIEGAFIDTKSDMEKLTPEKYATAIAECFGEVKGDKPVVEEKKSNALYRVQVGAYSERENADKMLEELKNKGFNGYIKEESKIATPKTTESNKPLSKYYETSNGLKIIETNPNNIYVATLPGKTLREFGIYGINGTWQNNKEAYLTRSIWGLAGNGNKAIGPNSYQNSPNGHKRGTIIYYEDGTLGIKRINSIKEITKPFKWCIGGGMLLPDYNPGLEKIAQDILRKTAHTGIGYKENRVFLIVHPKCLLKTFKGYVEKLNLDGAIFLDGGGSTQMNYKENKGIHSSRKLSHGIFLKKA